MKRFIFVLLALCLIPMALSACGGPHNVLTSGTVLDKHYDDDDSYYVPPSYHPGHESCTGGYSDGKGGYSPRSCYQTPGYTSPGYWVNIPPHWSIQIKGTDKKGKVHTEWHTVSESEYDRIRIGQVWEK